jgi:tyrosinase
MIAGRLFSEGAMADVKLRVRRSLSDLQGDYAAGDKKPLEDLWRAWKGIKALPPDDPNSFFMIGGYHGEPFRGAGWGNSAWWGGYCNHGNVLFPTWHRLYLLRLEDALRSVAGCEDVTLPYWDECSDESLKGGIPWALTNETVELDNATIPNPLRSFKFPQAIFDNINGDNPNYGKPNGYETVRYPLSGLRGTPQDIAQTEVHNAQYPDYATNVGILNKNVVAWLTMSVTAGSGQTIGAHVHDKYVACLEAPNYTLFSNTTSAQQWKNDHPTAPVTALESPHNEIHLAVGGFDPPPFGGPNSYSPILDANGDMGENDTAGLDPIFFFHHCFVDRVFWLWQQKHGFTKQLSVIPEYPGTNSVDNQGPTPGVAGGTWLGLDSPLAPFRKDDGGYYSSLDCIDSEGQLGVTYGPGSLQPGVAMAGMAAPAVKPAKVLAVSGVNRGAVRGSFLIVAYARQAGKRVPIGVEGVLSRWTVQGCANCQTHLEVKAFFPVHPAVAAATADEHYEIEIVTHSGPLPGPTAMAAAGAPAKPHYRLRVHDVP